MKGTVDRLHERRQIELAKSILEGAGYKVEKRVCESLSDIDLSTCPTVSEVFDEGDEDQSEDIRSMISELLPGVGECHWIDDGEYTGIPEDILEAIDDVLTDSKKIRTYNGNISGMQYPEFSLMETPTGERFIAGNSMGLRMRIIPVEMNVNEGHHDEDESVFMLSDIYYDRAFSEDRDLMTGVCELLDANPEDIRSWDNVEGSNHAMDRLIQRHKMERDIKVPGTDIPATIGTVDGKRAVVVFRDGYEILYIVVR